MFKALGVGCIVYLMALAGCQPPPAEPIDKGKSGPKSESTKPFDSTQLEPLLLKDKPAEAKSIDELRKNGKHDEKVVIMGKVPPSSVYLIRQTMAELKLADNAFLESNEAKAEFKDNHSLT